MKKALSLILAGAMLVGVLPAAAMAEEKPFDGVTLTAWMGPAEYNDVTQELLDKAEEELGIHVEVEINPGGTEGDNIIKTRCASGDLPDISNYNSGSLFTALNPKEHFLDLTDEPICEMFDDTFKSVVSQDGRRTAGLRRHLDYTGPFPRRQLQRTGREPDLRG